MIKIIIKRQIILREKLILISEINSKNYIFIAFVSSIVACFSIFTLEFFTNMTGFFYFADHIFDMTSYKAFMNSSWQFPLSEVDNIYPQKDFSIILLNFIPAYLLPLKLIKSISGIYFINPFPFWYIICFFLSAVFTGKILVAFKIKNPIVFFLSIFLVITNPLMINRMVYHIALSSHWIIIGCLYYYLLTEKNDSKNFIKFSILTGLSLFVQPYITFMLSVFLGFLFIKLIYTKNTKNALKGLATYLLIIVSYFVFIYSPFKYVNNADSYRGRWSAEFNSFFCSRYPIDFINDRFFCFEPYINYDHEGYAYLGLGIILSLFVFLVKPRYLVNKLRTYKTLVVSSLVLLLLSFGNHWKIAHKQIFEFEYPIIFREIISVFRSNGRFSWIFYYSLFFCILITIAKLKKNISIFLFILISLFQLTDISNLYNNYEKYWFNNLEKPIHLIDESKNIINPDNGILYILPDERCFHKENLYYVDDPLIFSMHYLDMGGKINSMRIGRYSGEFGNREFCDTYSVQKEIDDEKPNHFVISDLNLIRNSNVENLYTCIKIDPYLNPEFDLGYCEIYK